MNKFLLVPKFEAINVKKYKVKNIQDSAVYIKITSKYLSKLYHLVT